MTDEWVETTLGEIAEWRGGLTPSMSNASFWVDGDIPWISSREVVGGVLRDTARRVTTKALVETSLRLLAPGAVVVVVRSGILLHTFPVAYVPFACTVNQDVKAAQPVEGVDGRFLAILIEAHGPEILQRFRKTGTTVQSVDVPGLLGHRILLPPLQVQRRIVDLVAHIDAQVEALRAEVAAGEAMVGPLIEELVVNRVEGVAPLPLGEVGEFIRGRRFTKDEYVPTGLGCIHYGQVHTHFGPVAERALTFLPEESRSRLRLARPGDVVIAATSEDVTGLGKATVWLGGDDVAVHDDCYIFRHRLDPRFASYLFASPMFQRQKRQYAGGTKVTRISGSDLAKIEIPIPPIAVQARIGAALNALSDQVDAVHIEVTALRRLRAASLEELLSARIDIPQSYDELLHNASEPREVKR